MADPLSITASVIALSQAALLIAKGIRTLATIRHADSDVSSLLDELSVLHVLAEKIVQLKDSHRFTPADHEPLILKTARTRLQDTATSLEELIAVVVVADSDPNNRRISKRNWIRLSSKVKNCAKESREALAFGFNAINTLQL